MCGNVGSYTTVNGSAIETGGCLLLCRAVISFCPTLSPMSAYITAEQMNSLSAELVLVIQPFYWMLLKVDSIICLIQCTPLIAPEAVYQTHIEIFTLNNIWLKNVHKQSQYLDIYGTKNQKGPFLDDANFGRFLLTPVILPKRKSLFNS